MRFSLALVVLLSGAGLLARPVLARTIWYVDAGNPNCPGSGTLEDPFCTIQAAVDAARDRDEIVVSPGEYVESVLFSGQDITLRSRDGAEVTTIRGPGGVPVVDFGTEPISEATLSGFSITGGFPHGIVCENGAYLTIRDNRIFGNRSNTEGAGISIRDASEGFRLQGNEIFANRRNDEESDFLVGGGLSVWFSNDVSIVGNTFRQNGASIGGGAFFGLSEVVFEGNEFFGNYALVAGAVIIENGDDGPDLPVSFTGDQFIENTAVIRSGAVELNRCTPVVQGCAFIRNVCVRGRAGGLAIGTFTTNSYINACRFEENRAGRNGGGIWLQGGRFLIDQTVFVHNRAEETGGAAHVETQRGLTFVGCEFIENVSRSGSALYTRLSFVPTLRGCTFRRNESDSGQHTIALEATHGAYIESNLIESNRGGGLSVVQELESRVTLIGNRIRGNGDSCVEGGGLRVANGDVILERNIFSENLAMSGGGIFRAAGTSVIRLTTNYLSRNQAVMGGGLYLDTDALTEIFESTLADNEATVGAAMASTATVPFIRDCIVWGHGSGVFEPAGGPEIEYSDVQGGYPGIGNIDADPRFLAPEVGDYRLSCTSPCIDAASQPVDGLKGDIEGNRRSWWGGFDMGADELGLVWRPSGPAVMGQPFRFTATAHPLATGSRAAVWISLSPDTVTGIPMPEVGIPVPRSSGRALDLIPDSLYLGWNGQPLSVRTVTLAGCDEVATSPFVIPNGPLAGLEIYYAGLLNRHGTVLDITIPQSLTLQ